MSDVLKRKRGNRGVIGLCPKCEEFSSKYPCEFKELCEDCLECVYENLMSEIEEVGESICKIDCALKKRKTEEDEEPEEREEESEIYRIIRLCEEKLEDEKDPWKRMVMLNMRNMAIEQLRLIGLS
jgi:hypothetical protein